MTTALLLVGREDKGHRILHREYFIEFERNAYSWQIVVITHRLEN